MPAADFNEDSLDDLYGGDMQDATGEKSGEMTALDELEMKHDQQVARVRAAAHARHAVCH